MIIIYVIIITFINTQIYKSFKVNLLIALGFIYKKMHKMFYHIKYKVFM